MKEIHVRIGEKGQPGIEPESPDNMLGAVNHLAIESPTLATWRSQLIILVMLVGNSQELSPDHTHFSLSGLHQYSKSLRD